MENQSNESFSDSDEQDLESELNQLPVAGLLPIQERGVDIDSQATYVCDSCGEEIVIPIDRTEGSHQEYVEDCPVCCHPIVIRIDIDSAGHMQVDSEHE